MTLRKMSQATRANLVFDTPEVAREKGRRGAARQNSVNRVYVYIDGQPFSYETIALRIGMSQSTARERVAAARLTAKKEGRQLTWSDIETTGEKK